MHTIVELNNIQLFAKNLEVLGDLSISNSDFRNAIHCYNKMRYLGEYTDNQDLKIRSLVHMSDTCKVMHKYSQAKKFLMKALQYVWYENKKD
jgi:hypothetical protein